MSGAQSFSGDGTNGGGGGGAFEGHCIGASFGHFEGTQGSLFKGARRVS